MAFLIFETILTFQLLVSTLLFLTNGPLLMALLVIIFSFIQGMICFLLFSKWLSLSMILVFIGGMMVIFLYVAGLSANNKLSININTFFMATLVLIMVILNFKLTLFSWSKMNTSPTLLFLPQSSPLIIFLTLFVLCTLFVVTKIPEGFKGSLTEKF